MPMPTDQLRLRREQVGLTLEDIQQRTRIRVDYLQAIEKGDFSVLPGKFAVRRTVEVYSKELGVDPVPLLKHLDKGEPTTTSSSSALVPVSNAISESSLPKRSRKAGVSNGEEKNLSENIGRGRSSRSTGRRGGKRKISFILIALISLVVIVPGIVFLVSVSGDKATTSREKKPSKDTTTTSQSKSSPIRGDSSVVKLVKPSETYKYGDLFAVSKADQVNVVLKAKKETTFTYRQGGPTKKVVEKGKIKAGEKKSFQHKEWVSLKVGTPASVQLMVNGHLIDTTSDSKDHSYQFQRKS
ncbi:protein RodZ, contains Xre-like HTH and DUF4115 domains [Marininema mesophilum]|uniref:Protein RodZ, contains Xre-like HTH and DUF4115 domains n=1 Tax=Marininema mesophilum TaxID=1048340 RepID=A0A1H2ZCC5_9BACL|nr:helix-turn-helix transcriptional regulator [Marininema mesophilum]SDX15041.1 protein RodZ, contains Xre-like HTH and DUF4115 domains [Marininema mesophilum]